MNQEPDRLRQGGEKKMEKIVVGQGRKTNYEFY
jgi:hypothetical protein